MSTDSGAPRTAITDVRVFDGAGLSDPVTVVVDGNRIAATTSAEDAAVVDGRGGTLLPGLIDAHVHLHGPENQEQAARWGVTTMLDMGTQPSSLVDSLRDRPQVTDIRSAGSPASAPGSLQTTRMGYDPSTALAGPADAVRFVESRVAEGVDHLKVVVEDPLTRAETALDRATIAALVAAGHARGLRVVAHVTTTAAFRLATDAGVDVLTHAPLDAVLAPDLIAAMVERSVVSVPTLTMMRAVAGLAAQAPPGAGPDYAHAEATVRALHRAGVPIVAGTDANAAPGSPAPVAHGRALHDELVLLVSAGLPPVDALRAATVLPAQLFGLSDRGVVEPGHRADLVLVHGDPTRDIGATVDIRGAWIAGHRVR